MTDRPEAANGLAANSARHKVRTLDELGMVAELARARGRKVVLAHGVFDLLHPGHIRHLEAAKREGDVLIVTCTADRFVNKGPNRPAFAENLRAEMLAAVHCVDWVGVNMKPTAVNVIETIKPDVFVKGEDYADPSQDITGKIADERQAVESHGGRIVFTHDITFSSTTLINRFLDIHEPRLRDYLDRLRGENALAAIAGEIEKLSTLEVLLVGETIIDEYSYVRAVGKSPKEHMIATRFEGNEVFAGGVIATAKHVAEVCHRVVVVTLIGADDGDATEAFLRRSLPANVELIALRREGPTVRKVRFVDQGYLRKLFEVQHMDDRPIDRGLSERLEAEIARRAPGAALTLVNDFGHGMILPSLVATLTGAARFLAINVQSNSANLGFNLIDKYPRADFLCIDTIEARLATRDRHNPIRYVADDLLPRIIDCPRMIVTMGVEGCLVHEAGQPGRIIPAFTRTVTDTMGAGDAFFALASPLVAAGCPVEYAGLAGNAAGAIKVGIVGHRESVGKVALLKYITSLLR